MFFIKSILACSALSVAAVRAFDSISISNSVAAGSATQVTIKNDISSSKSFDAQFDNFRIYLAATPPGWGTGPICTLVNSTTISTTSVSVTIPADVGPSGEFYKISTMEWNSDPSKDGPSGFQYSDSFTLTGGTGNWSLFELSGAQVWDADSIMCEGYGCARQCANGLNVNDLNENSSDATVEAWYSCVLKCPGAVALPTADSDGGDNSTTPAVVGASSVAPGSKATSAASSVHTASSSAANATGSASSSGSAIGTGAASGSSTSTASSGSAAAAALRTSSSGAVASFSGISPAVALLGLLPVLFM